MMGVCPRFLLLLGLAMATSTVNFISYNSTGLDTVKTKWVRDLSDTTNTPFIGIQEHFKSNKNTEKYFQDQFPSFNSHVTPGFREPGINAGRPKGGLAQLIDKRFKMIKNKISVNNSRVQAQILQLPTTHLLWINAYFPTDSGAINMNIENENELLTLLREN